MAVIKKKLVPAYNWLEAARIQCNPKMPNYWRTQSCRHDFHDEKLYYFFRSVFSSSSLLLFRKKRDTRD